VSRALEGRVALVTGASAGGTGTAIAVRFAAEGAAVAIVARGGDGLAGTAARIRSDGGTALELPCDLSDPAGGRDALVARVEDALGPIDVLVNNAAVNGYRPFDEWTPRRLELAQQVNVWAPWQLMADAAASMRPRGEGWILNLSSFAATAPPGPPFPRTLVASAGCGYGVTKAALERLTVGVAAELHDHGVAVNALAPQSAVATPHLVATGGLAPEQLEPLETMAEAALALCSGDPGRLTGRLARSLELLVELDRPVRSLDGSGLHAGWQPADLPAVIAAQAASLEARGWPAPFGRSPR
jgi:NAD(P)-dependent dehydrogenase (short-subunit alcohol dehydrogenase family)